MKFSINWRPLLVLPMLIWPGSTLNAGAHEGSRGLPVAEETQLELRDFLNQFIERMTMKHYARVGELNGGLEIEQRRDETEWSVFDLGVTRGEVVEKAGSMVAVGKKLSPGRGDGVLTWGRFYSFDVHPKTPLVGMLHATIVMQMFEDNTVQTGGWLGVMPGTRVDIDLERLKQLTDDYFARYDKDPALYRRLICKGTSETIAEFRRKPACSGVSFYGPPVYRDDPGESIRFIAGLFEEFTDDYLNIIAERADDEYAAADIVAQDNMRRRWLIDQLFSDPFASKIVPFDVWSFANMPPIVKF